MTSESLITALDAVTWYNGLAEEIVKWKNPDNYSSLNPIGIPYQDGMLVPKIEFRFGWPEDCKEQLEVFWMICVLLFGNYGSSPRVGWIEKKDEFFKFIDNITSTYQDSEIQW